MRESELDRSNGDGLLLALAVGNLRRRCAMTDIVKKTPRQIAVWDPFRMMRDLLRWDPFREMTPAFPAAPGSEVATFTPSFDVTESKDAYLFKADVPGVKKEDLEITTAGNRLQIFGKRDSDHETKTDTVYTYERQYGSFMRTFTLPDGADLEAAKSELENGVLTVAIPKQSSAQAKKIAISTDAPKS
jgi:HSP20 family protein